jgi:Protein of unknown function (DUF2442)
MTILNETVSAQLCDEDLLVTFDGEQYHIPTDFLPNFHSDYPLPSNAELIILRNPPTIDHVYVSDSALQVYLTDGRLIAAPLAWYPRLSLATPAERNHYEIRYDSIHWPEVDEDIDLEALLIGGRSCESAASISRWLQARHQKGLETRD